LNEINHRRGLGKIMNTRIGKIAAWTLGASLLGLQICATAGAQEREHAERAAPGRGGDPRGVGRPGAGAPRVDGRGQVLDARYNHGHYYPAFGASVRVLPGGYRPVYFHGSPYYFSAGVWYGPGPGGFVVVRPPYGVVISVLPPYYSTVWFGGVPYYYADNVYYTWDPTQNGYTVVPPPDGADQPTAAPADAAPAQQDLIVYPKNGQSADQQAADKYECYNWARGQSGFDPTQPNGGVADGNPDLARSNYYRADSACLTGRGYQVN
jgi:hypothetical protein